MARLTIDLDPLVTLHGKTDIVKVLAKNGIACDIAGADGVLVSTGNEYDITRRKAILTLIDCLDISLAVKAILDEQWIEALQEIRPHMVIFDYSENQKDQLARVITGLQVANILAAIRLPLDLELIKQAAKLKCDYVVLDCAEYCDARSLGSQIDALNKIETVSALASRLSIGIIAAGEFDPNRLSRIVGNKFIEEYFIGAPFISQALINGYQHAIDSFKRIMR
jgi:pyridoxine 5'-phosphate synthase PdxJ